MFLRNRTFAERPIKMRPKSAFHDRGWRRSLTFRESGDHSRQISRKIYVLGATFIDFHGPRRSSYARYVPSPLKGQNNAMDAALGGESDFGFDLVIARRKAAFCRITLDEPKGFPLNARKTEAAMSHAALTNKKERICALRFAVEPVGWTADGVIGERLMNRSKQEI